jgi:hypothetical protein
MFIKLETDSGKYCLLNVNNISEVYDRSTYRSIMFNNSSMSLTVKNSLSEIERMLRECIN